MFSDLQYSDSGLYTCVASSESGETTWSASLTVDRSSEDMRQHKAPEPSKFPLAPGQPKAVDVTNTSITITWSFRNFVSLLGFTVEYYSSALQTGWIIAAHRVPNNTVTVSCKWIS